MPINVIHIAKPHIVVRATFRTKRRAECVQSSDAYIHTIQFEWTFLCVCVCVFDCACFSLRASSALRWRSAASIRGDFSIWMNENIDEYAMHNTHSMCTVLMSPRGDVRPGRRSVELIGCHSDNFVQIFPAMWVAHCLNPINRSCGIRKKNCPTHISREVQQLINHLYSVVWLDRGTKRLHSPHHINTVCRCLMFTFHKTSLLNKSWLFCAPFARCFVEIVITFCYHDATRLFVVVVGVVVWFCRQMCCFYFCHRRCCRRRCHFILFLTHPNRVSIHLLDKRQVDHKHQEGKRQQQKHLHMIHRY